MDAATKRLIGRGLVFLFLLLFPFGQLLRTEFSFFYLSIPVILVDLIAILSFFLVLVLRIKTPNTIKPFIAFILAAGFSLLLSLAFFDLEQVLLGAMYFVRLVAYFALLATAAYSFSEVNKKKKVFDMLVLVLVVISVFGWIQYFTFPDLRILKVFGWDDHLGRLVSTLIDPGFTSILLVFGFIASFFVYLRKNKYGFLLLSFIFIATLAFTYSRAGYLALVASLVVISKIEKQYLKVLIIFLSFIGMILLLPRTAGEGVRLERTSSIYARFANYQKSSEIFNLSPVFGVGYNNLCLVKSDLGENPNTRSCSGLDSSLWVVLATTGVVGLMILIGSGKQVLNKLNNNMYAKVFITCLWALLVHSLFVNSLFYPWVMGWMGILLAISLTQKTSEQ